MVDFELVSTDQYSVAFREIGIHSFSEACEFVAKLPYGRNSNRLDVSLVFKEKKGNCSSKHALLAYLADENQQNQVELMVGIFLLSPDTHPELTPFFEQIDLDVIPEAHCYLRIQGKRFDFTSKSTSIQRIEPKLVREQRIEPNQVSDWKVKIHQDYIAKWLLRNPQLAYSPEALWEVREQMIEELSTLNRAI